MKNPANKKLKLGFIINPWAGVGGAVALKGSDGDKIRQQALELGAIPQAQKRAEQALKLVLPLKDRIEFVTVSGKMGESLLKKMGFQYQLLLETPTQTSGQDTTKAASLMELEEVDLIIFVGGDGTARDLHDGLSGKSSKNTLVLGIPAGTKIHSGVYCITPTAAGELIVKVINGDVVEVVTASVMDIDENLFRQGRVQARLYGEMRVPDEPLLIQAVKSGSQVDESINQLDIAEGLCERWQPEHLYIIGSGTTLAVLMEQLQLTNTLLGIDVVLNGEVIAADVTASQLLTLLEEHQSLPKTLLVTVIGAQGHVFGRGNQQLSPDVIKAIGKSNIQIVATKAKVAALSGRPFISDTGDCELDHWLAGRYAVQVDYNETWLYVMG